MADLRKYNDSKRGLFAHDERNLNNPVKFRKNYEIDGARTHLNYDLISGKTGETAERGELEKRLEARLAQLTIRKRRENTVTFGSWVVTLPAELKGAEEGKQREFFKHTLTFMQSRYGKDNIIGFWVHNDETTPHVHVKFVPEQRAENSSYNNFQGTGVLLAKDIFKRGEYQSFHRDLQKHLEQAMGMRLSIINGATKARGKNASIEELKGETALEQQKALESAKAVQRAAAQWSELGKQAAALCEHYAAAVKDAQRMAAGGSLLWKSGWQKRLEALEAGQEDMSKMHEQAQKMAEQLSEAARLVPDWMKSGHALMAAAADMSARARSDADKEKTYWRSWQQNWQGRLLRQQQDLERRAAQLEALAEERAEEKLQARRDVLAELDKRTEAAKVAALLAEGQRDKLQQEAQQAQNELDQVAPKLLDARQRLIRSEEAIKQRQEEAERLRQCNTPAGLLKEALDASCAAYGHDLTVDGINAQLQGGDAQQHIHGALEQQRQQEQEQQRSSGPGMGW